ncbi:hypothetical protein [Kineococcus sp. SYSU DK002]|uniref:hypothetical protein n=1 Tax=Kineococcus sp. SYSU DK002 TaxID=3383123 RepID=UPI003D7E355F
MKAAFVLPLLTLAACSRPSDVAPPVAAATPAPVTASASPAPATGLDGDAAVVAFRGYLREQALAVNAGSADPAAVPGFTATLTPAARSWALPLLADNLGDRMPGPYPSGVLEFQRPADDRVELRVCLQDRGWQVDRTSGQPLNAEHHGTARAVVVRVDDRWLVDDVVADGGECTAADVVPERF